MAVYATEGVVILGWWCYSYATDGLVTVGL
jgi:hypothetical protein